MKCMFCTFEADDPHLLATHIRFGHADKVHADALAHAVSRKAPNTRPLLALPVVEIDIDAIHKHDPADSEQVRQLKRAVARYERAKRVKAEWWHALSTSHSETAKAES